MSEPIDEEAKSAPREGNTRAQFESSVDQAVEEPVEICDGVNDSVPTKETSSATTALVNGDAIALPATDRLSTSSSCSDEITASPCVESELMSVNDQEESEKRASDSGYESDRRKSFSSAADGEAAAAAADAVRRMDDVNGSMNDGEEETPPRRRDDDRDDVPRPKVKECRLPPLIPPRWPFVKPIVPIPHWQQHPLIAYHRHAFYAHPQLFRPLMPHPAMQHKQVEAAMGKPQSGPREHQLKFFSAKAQDQHPHHAGLQSQSRPTHELPPVMLPLPVCCKASPVGPKEARRFVIPKYAVGFVIGHNGIRIQATRDVSGATILLLGDKDEHHSVVGVFGTLGQIHDAEYLMKQNILRHSGMFIGDINGMLKEIND